MKTKQLLKELKKVILKTHGKTCTDFNWFCPGCSVWLAYRILESLLIPEDEN